MDNEEFVTDIDWTEQDFNKWIERQKLSPWEKFKVKVSNAWSSFKDWIGKQSLTEILTGLTIISSIISVIFKAIRSTRKSGTERLADQRDFGYYDPHTGIRWDLKRKMTNNEKAELVRRMDDGEPVDEILKDLGVYKYR